MDNPGESTYWSWPTPSWQSDYLLWWIVLRIPTNMSVCCIHSHVSCVIPYKGNWHASQKDYRHISSVSYLHTWSLSKQALCNCSMKYIYIYIHIYIYIYDMKCPTKAVDSVDSVQIIMYPKCLITVSSYRHPPCVCWAHNKGYRYILLTQLIPLIEWYPSESLNSLTTRRCAIDVKVSSPNTCHGLSLEAFLMNLLSSEFNRPRLMTSHHLSSKRLCAVWQQAITIDLALWHHMASECSNKLNGDKI